MDNPRPEVLLVTGGGSGIGLECALQAARRGARVAVLDVQAAAAEEAARRLGPSSHLGLAVDVTDLAAVQGAVAEVAERLGRPTGVVTAAGIVERAPLREVSPEAFRRVLAVNVEGVQNTVSAAAPHLIDAGAQGAVVALGSVAASTGGGLMGSGAYATSKAAVLGLIRGYARELAPWGVRANVVAPAATDTPMTQSLSEEDRRRITAMTLTGRLSRPSEIASVVSFLLGDGASAMTGQLVQANGGVLFS